ncbi:hypothetical protein HLB23_34050 [Nocardia uniformis]|uniref:Uncharacterized protein n=1 Tax=Nocardia uniformis TaxID=53432 RepID=A0A849CAE1_9NOCA|nr:hypothetical protein [Nocardia uniformis]NNH74816.1 hypothetical protein [Nocardia uniformis]
MSITITLSDQDKATVRTAAYGAVSLLAAASAKPHKVATAGTTALYSATGLVGHVLAAKSKDIKLQGKTVADLADQVLPALTAAVSLFEQQAPAEADNFRTIVFVALETAQTQGAPSPILAEMIRKVTEALHAA